MDPMPRNHRPPIMGRNGAVGANHPAAALVGLDVLRAGGNAVDASVATALALGVCEPMMSGLGGDGFYHVFMAAGGASVFNGTGPGAAGRDAGALRLRHPAHRAAQRSRCRARSPASPRCTRPTASCRGPRWWRRRSRSPATALRRPTTIGISPPTTAPASRPIARSASVFLGHELAGLVVQPDLARTLEEIAADGAETFYRGRLAARLAGAMGDAGVLVTAADLAAFRAERRRRSASPIAASEVLPDAAELHRLRHAADAEDRRALRPRRRSPRPSACT